MEMGIWQMMHLRDWGGREVEEKTGEEEGGRGKEEGEVEVRARDKLYRVKGVIANLDRWGTICMPQHIKSHMLLHMSSTPQELTRCLY